MNIFCSPCNDYIGFNVATRAGTKKNLTHKDFIFDIMGVTNICFNIILTRLIFMPD